MSQPGDKIKSARAIWAMLRTKCLWMTLRWSTDENCIIRFQDTSGLSRAAHCRKVLGEVFPSIVGVQEVARIWSIEELKHYRAGGGCESNSSSISSNAYCIVKNRFWLCAQEKQMTLTSRDRLASRYLNVICYCNFEEFLDQPTLKYNFVYTV